jgi:CheY-like chemotaxis protein
MPPESASTRRNGAGEPGRGILVVEDNEVNALILRAMLLKLGYEAMVASDGFEGLEIVGRLRPRLVLMDLQMPRLDGLAAASSIRALGVGEDETVLVAVTASAAREVQNACEDAGFACILAKPIVFRELEEILSRYVAA